MAWWTDAKTHPKTKSKFVVVFGSSFYLPNVKSLNKPKVEFDTKDYRLLNHKFNYPGNATWQPVTIKFVDMNGQGSRTEHFDTGAFLWQIMNNTGYRYPDVDNSIFRDSTFRGVNANISKSGPAAGSLRFGGHHLGTKVSLEDNPDTDVEEKDTFRTLTTPEKASNVANSFGLGLDGVADYQMAGQSKQRVSIYQISHDGKDGGVKGSIITECWHLINPIVKSISWGDLDYSSDELVEYELGVVYDWAMMDRTKIGEPFSVDSKSFTEFMKTLFVDNPEAIMERREGIIERAVPALTTEPESSRVLDQSRNMDLTEGSPLPPSNLDQLGAAGNNTPSDPGVAEPLGDIPREERKDTRSETHKRQRPDELDFSSETPRGFNPLDPPKEEEPFKPRITFKDFN